MESVTESAKDLSKRAQRLYGGERSTRVRFQVLRPFICPFEEILPLVPAGSSVLDAGCGAGLFLGLLADTGRIREGAGFDSSDAAVTLANLMVQNLSAGTAINIQRIDATAEWPAQEYDVVSLIDVMHHVPPANHADVLEQACRCIRSGGLLLYKDMATRPRWRAMCNQMHDLVMARQWIHHVPMSFVEGWAKDHGMTAVEGGAAVRYWYAHEWRVFRKMH